MKIILITISLGCLFLQACTSSFIKRGTASEMGPKFIDSKFTFSADYRRPSSKQGASEARVQMAPEEFDVRYKVLSNWGASYREYNYWWSALESSGMTSSLQPIDCPVGYELIPANAEQKARLGFRKYRCINQGTLSQFDNLFRRDQDAGMQTGIVMWSSPDIYRYPGCTGFDFAGNKLKEGCVPRDDAMDDFEDYANLLASRYNGQQFGKISHFIVWNENASSGWFDYSPIGNDKDKSGPTVERRIDKLAEMMKRVHNALMRHQRGALMYTSTDMLWEPGLHRGHYGTRMMLEGLWKRLGIKYSWSVAVHPYGDVDGKVERGTYTFQNLELVSQFQVKMLKANGITNVDAYPQKYLLASEQGWPFPIKSPQIRQRGRENQARQMCLAHEKVMLMPEVLAVGHNYFHSTEDKENEAGGTSPQGAFYGLIPQVIPNTLEGAENTAVGKAFISTMNPSNFFLRNDHYCCQVYGLGCVGQRKNKVPSIEETHEVKGVIDGVVQTSEGYRLKGWACARTMDESIVVHLYANAEAGRGGTLIGGYMSNLSSEAAIANECMATGKAYRFDIPLDNSLRQKVQGQKIFVHAISPIGSNNLTLFRSGELIFPSADRP